MPFEHAAVDLVLPSSSRDVVDAAGEQELGAIQADAFGAGVARRREIVGELDVRVEPDRARRRRSPPAAAARRRPSAPGR